MFDVVGPVLQDLQLALDFVDIGGGFGIPYLPDEKSLDIEATAEKVVSMFKNKIKQFNLGNPTLFVEPGRYLVGDAGYLLGKVHSIKQGYSKFVGTDIGMSVLARPVLYGAYHHVYVDGKSKTLNSKPEMEVVTLTGQACENADAWGKDRKLPPMNLGDLIVVANAGAYGYVMSYPYNGRFRAAEVLIDQEKGWLIRKRETLGDWLSLVPGF